MLKKTSSIKTLPAAALRAAWREGYGFKNFSADLLAGLVVGIVALPLSMALSIAVGAPPEHGLYTAIVAGFLVAALGGSRAQVTGPTAAFIVILAPICSKFGLGGLLISMGLLRLGRFIEYIPHPVTTGFTAGIGTVIAVLQLKDLLGLQLAKNPESFFERLRVMFEALPTASVAELSLGVMTLILLLLLPRLTSKVPAPLIALPIASVAAILLSRWLPNFEVATIASRFHYVVDGQTFNGIPRLPPLFSWPWHHDATPALTFETFRALVPGAFAIAMLGAIESLLSAVIADGMLRTKHDPDAELLALGIGNTIVPFFGGIAATGAIARTATNIRSGGRTPIAAMTHAVVILLAILMFAPWLGYLPMTSLAALLLLVAWRMSEAHHFVRLVRAAPGTDVAVLFTCFGLTVAFDMVIGVSVGMVLAAFLFMHRMAQTTQTQVFKEEHPSFPAAIPKDVVIYDISGPLFFGAAERAMTELYGLGVDNKVIILLLHGVQLMDATGVVAFESALRQLKQHGSHVILVGGHKELLRVLHRAHLHKNESVSLCDNAKEALTVAHKLIEKRA
jgi:SulP family sulfate permease